MILFIDDDEFGMRPYRLSLEGSGFKVEIVGSPDTALAFLESHHEDVDLIVLDELMPTGASFTAEETDFGLRTGEVLLERLRKRWPHLEVIVLSITNVGERDVWEKMGAVDVLWKADTLPSELVEVVRDRISTRSERV